MKQLILFVCCTVALVAGSSKDIQQKRISLEDIERDNLKIGTPVSRSVEQKTPSPSPANSPTTYGFLPVKTASDYARQQPSHQYIQPQYIQPQAQQQYVPQQQYYYQQQPYQQYENVQYITDNSIHAGAQQQYYAPQTHHQQQYVYLQQYTAPSTAIQTVVDPKGGVQYFMYLPAAQPSSPEAQQPQNYGIVYANEASNEYVQEQPAPSSVKYVESGEAGEEASSSGSREPKSLLDSYVPSYLQIQYYKQQQANSIQESLKELATAGGVKRPLSSSNSNYNYIPSH